MGISKLMDRFDMYINKIQTLRIICTNTPSIMKISTHNYHNPTEIYAYLLYSNRDVAF